MKRLLLILSLALAFCLPAQAKTLDPDTTIATSSGSIRALAKQVILVFSSDYTGTVNGVSYTWAAGGSINFAANQPGDTINTITYTIATGNIKIVRLQ